MPAIKEDFPARSQPKCRIFRQASVVIFDSPLGELDNLFAGLH